MRNKKGERLRVGIIGAGHNGLVCGAYLAKAGADVTIFERRDEVGGMCVTEELIPGFKISSAACWFGMLRKQIIEDLNLQKLGLQVYPANPQTFSPFPDGTYFASTLDQVETKRCIEALSASDARNWDRFWSDVFRAVEVIKPYLLKYPVTKEEVEKAVSFLGCSPFTTSVLDFLSRYFTSEKIKIPLSTLALAVRYGTPKHPGTLFNFLYMLTAETNGIPGAWGFVKGGMGTITDALRKSGETHGVKIFTEKTVKRVIFGGNSAKGVVLADDSKHYFDLIVSNVDPITTFTRLIEPVKIAIPFVNQVKKLDTSGSSAALHISLLDLPSFSKWKSFKQRLSGIVLIAPSFNYMEKSYLDFQKGIITDSPIITFSIPSITDPTLAPSGRHLLSMYVQYISPTIKWTRGNKDRLFANILNVLEQYNSGFKDIVEDWVLLTPDYFERVFGVYAGNHEHIQMMPSQLFEDRPVSDYGSYRTPLNNLYLCGSGTHPGGTVTGACGYNCANLIIESTYRL